MADSDDGKRWRHAPIALTGAQSCRNCAPWLTHPICTGPSADVPPPLESLSGQLEALQLRAGGSAPSSSTAAGELPVAATTIVNSAAAPAKPAAPQIKKGFFDAKPSKPKPKPAAAPPKPKADEEEIIEIKARKDTFGSGPRIPDFMKIEPSEQEKAYAAYRNQLQDALKPTPDMVSKVAADPMLAAGASNNDLPVL